MAPIPDFQTIMLPFLHGMSDGEERSINEIVENLAIKFGLSEQELSELLPSGRQPVFYNRVGWARTYLVKSCLLEMTRRSYVRITDRGKEVLKKNPQRIDMKFLTQFPEYIEFKYSHRKKTSRPDEETTDDRTPEEILEDAYQEIRDGLAQDLLTQIKRCSPSFFERLVVELLVKMGYGGSRKEAARAVGQSGDGGIDGIIDEDRLGLDSVYIQAKRWEGNVGRPEIQKFVGALMGKRARKGVFITTSCFSAEAFQYIQSIDFNVVLIDGKRLTDLMIDYDLGVAEVNCYQVKRIDTDYFD